MDAIPSRDTPAGFGLYYLNLLLLIASCIYGVNTGHPGMIVIAIVLVSLLVLQDLAWVRTCTIAAGDKALIERISEMLGGEHTRALLMDSDFTRCAVHEPDLKNLQVILDQWAGVDYSFRNQRYQAIWDDLRGHARMLLDILRNHARYTNAHNFSIAGSGEGEAANHERQAIFDAYQQLRRIYIRKLPYG